MGNRKLKRIGNPPNCCGTVKWYNHCRKLGGGSSVAKHRSAYDSAIPLLGIPPKEWKQVLKQKLAHECSEEHC